MPSQSDVAASARRLLTAAYDGILSTHSVDVPGYPFGSVMPYCLDRAGCPVILIASIAQHTHNLRANPKCSLIVMDRSAPDLQASGRLTVLADAAAIQDEDVAERYYRYFPESRDYHRTHDFAFYRLQPVRARYIGGFGRIHWVAAERLVMPNAFDAAQESMVVSHMNADHAAALAHYCGLIGEPVTEGERPEMTGIDAEGLHMRLGQRILRLEFTEPLASPAEARRVLVEMARAPLARSA